MGKVSINLSTASIRTRALAVGIDLGTTNSLIAYVHEDTGQPACIAAFDNSCLLPSVVAISSEGLRVGAEALAFLEKHPEHGIASIKRLIGVEPGSGSTFNNLPIRYNASQSTTEILLGQEWHSVVELSAAILSKLKQRAEAQLHVEVTDAVITVPAYFNDKQRSETRRAGELAGLHVIRIINEPTAAALAYQLDKQGLENILIYDFGGGTFDVSILSLQDTIYEVLATQGDTQLGGYDIDQAIVEGWRRSNPSTIIHESQLQALARQAKEHLSTAGSTLWEKDGFSLSQEGLAAVALPIIQRTLSIADAALADAGLTPSQLDAVVLVGGSTRMPLLQAQVEKHFGKVPLQSLNPDEVVALGAARQAYSLTAESSDALLLDVTPLSLGIETGGGLMDVLIPRNSKIPSRVAREYTTSRDGQVRIRIAVYQGERELVEDNRRIANFELSGIPAMPAGMPKIQITFSLDADGILTVMARELRSGIAQQVTLSHTAHLDDQEVENMLMAGFVHAKEDLATRAHREVEGEARQTLYTTENFLKKHAEYVTMDEESAARRAVDTLKQALASHDLEPLRKALDELEATTRPMAERVMDLAVAAALKGRALS